MTRGHAVRRQTYGYLLSCRTLPLFDGYQIIGYCFVTDICVAVERSRIEHTTFSLKVWCSNTLHRHPVHSWAAQSESESECKCLTCNQKPTGSQFSLLHRFHEPITKRLMETKLKRKPLSSPVSVKAVWWKGWGLYQWLNTFETHVFGHWRTLSVRSGAALAFFVILAPLSSVLCTTLT